MFSACLSIANALGVRRPARAAASASTAHPPASSGFTAADWAELSQRWRQSSGWQAPRVLHWRARREVGAQLNGCTPAEAAPITHHATRGTAVVHGR